jgi:hypothetical protein
MESVAMLPGKSGDLRGLWINGKKPDGVLESPLRNFRPVGVPLFRVTGSCWDESEGAVLIMIPADVLTITMS